MGLKEGIISLPDILFCGTKTAKNIEQNFIQTYLCFGVYTPLPESQIPYIVWSWNLHQWYPLTKEIDWWRHHFDHVTNVF